MYISVLLFGLLCRIVLFLKFIIHTMFLISKSFHPSSAPLLLQYPFLLSIITGCIKHQYVQDYSLSLSCCDTAFSFATCVTPPRDLTYSKVTFCTSFAVISQQKHALHMCCSLHSLLSSLCPWSLLRLHHAELTASWLLAFPFLAVNWQHSGSIKPFSATGPQGFKPWRDQSPVTWPDLGLWLVFQE